MPKLTVATIIMKDRANVLLVKPFDGPDAGVWAIPDTTVKEGVTVRDTTIRLAQHNLGLEVEPKMTLFICERVEPEDHRVGVFVLAEPVGLPDQEFTANESLYSEAKWIDVRSLGELQQTEGLSEFSADAFVKFSGFLRSQAPSSGRVN